MSTNVGLTDRQIAILRSVFSPYAAKIDRVTLFGSRATGLHRDNSDIDLAIHGALNERDVDRIWTSLDESALAVSADVVVYDRELYAPLRRHIDQFGKLLFDRDALRLAA